MRFNLFNLLAVNSIVALGLALMLGDESQIQKNAAQYQKDINYIAESAVWRQVPSHLQAKEPMNRKLLFYNQ